MDRRQKIALLFSDCAEEFKCENNENIPENSPKILEFDNQPLSPTFKPLKSSNSQLFKKKEEIRDQNNFKQEPSCFGTSRDYLEKAGNVRWLILVLSCFIMFGNFYAYDNPSALNRQLKAWMADKSDAEFEYHLNLLYTIYSAPNIVLPFVVGRALDRYGSRSFLIGLSLLMCVGQAVFAMGVGSRMWIWMLIGRLIFGLGGESLAVAQSRLVTEWFLGKEVGIAIGLNLSVARIGTVFNNNASPRIANMPEIDGGGVPGACWIGFGTCLFSLLCTLICIFIDALYRPSESKSNQKYSTKFKSSDSHENAFTSTFPLETDEEFIHPAFYFLLILNFLSYGTVICFNTVASAYLQERYFPENIFKANWAMSIPDTAAIFMVPLIGLAVDRSGWKLGTISLGQCALAIGHLWLAMAKSPSNPYGALIILGIGYSTLLAIWSCVPYLVGSRRQATAYGYLISSTNLSSTLLPIIVAAFVSADQSYLRAGLFFATLGISGLVICAQVSVLNTSQSLGLNSSCSDHNHLQSFYQVSQRLSKSIEAEVTWLKEINIKPNQIADERTSIYLK